LSGKINDGGPAFPHLHNHCQRVNETEHHEGLSVRDWFAGQVISALIASMERGSNAMLVKRSGIAPSAAAAEMAYAIADAMLAAREKAAS